MSPDIGCYHLILDVEEGGAECGNSHSGQVRGWEIPEKSSFKFSSEIPEFSKRFSGLKSTQKYESYAMDHESNPLNLHYNDKMNLWIHHFNVYKLLEQTKKEMLYF